VVAILGARQVGKTTLAHQVADSRRGPTHIIDLEDPRERARLAESMLVLEPLRGLVILDEIQLRPDLFSTTRVLADRRPRPARFLVLGSASPDLLRQGSETLAGRIAFHDLGGFDIEQVIHRLGVARSQCYFWATHGGAELDLLVMHRGRRLGFEMKRTATPRLTPSMRSALETLGLHSLTVIHAGKDSFPLAKRVRALAASDLLDALKPRR